MEAMLLLEEAAGDGIDVMLASELCSKLLNITRRYVGFHTAEKDRINAPEFREGVWKVMEAVLDVLPKDEQNILLEENIQGYSCTSDCFRSF
jgi:hypothetical protein